MKSFNETQSRYNPYPQHVTETFEEYLEHTHKMLAMGTPFWSFTRPSKFKPEETDNEVRAKFLSEEYCLAWPRRVNVSLGLSLYCHNVKTAPYAGNKAQLHYLGMSSTAMKLAIAGAAELGLSENFKVRNFHLDPAFEKCNGYSTWGVYIQGPLRNCRRVDPVNPTKALFEGVFFRPDLGELRRMADNGVFDDWQASNPTTPLIDYLKAAGKKPVSWRVAALLCFYAGIPFSNFVRGNWMEQNDRASLYEWCKLAFPDEIDSYDLSILASMIRSSARPTRVYFRGNLMQRDYGEAEIRGGRSNTLSAAQLSEIDLFSSALGPSKPPVPLKEKKPAITEPYEFEDMPPKFVNGGLPEIDEDSSFVGFGGLPVMEDVD